MAKVQEIRILCFGASITAGALPSHTHITVDVDGLSGDQVLGGQYLSRLEPHFGTAATMYDWLIFQDGGNDLGWSREPAPIFDGLKKFWKIGLEGGAKVMALTVTETNNESKLMKQRYEKLNDMIRNHHDENFFVADVCKRVPYATMDRELRERVWDDGLHFKPPGYDMLGDAIADRLIEISQVSSSQQ